MQEGHEDDIEFFEAGEDSTEAFESAEEPLDFIACFIESAVVFSRLDAVGLGMDAGEHSEFQHQLPGFVAFVSAIHNMERPSGIGPSCRSKARPSGASCALPGESAKVMAVRAFAATR